MIQILKSRECLGGLLIAAIGAVLLFLASDLRTGSFAQMGPGYLPKALSWCLMGLGTLIAIKSWFAEAEQIRWPPLRAMLPLLAAPLVFSLLIETAGLLITILLVTLIARLAIRETRWFSVETIVFSVGLSFSCGLLFVILLGQQMPLLPQ